MNMPVRVSLLFRATLALAAFALHEGCADNQALQQGTPITWDSPRLLGVKDEWDSVSRSTKLTKDNYGDVMNQLNQVLRKHLRHADLRELAASCDSLAIRSQERSDFANALLAFMVRVFVDSGDRESLLELLSTRCPLHIAAYSDIEFWLAFRGRKLKDPVLLLGEAYAKCRVPEVRRDIAGAVRRGFADLEIAGKDDAEFVNNAMQWYKKEKDHLTVNSMYDHNAMLFPWDMYEQYPQLYERFPKAFKREPLFHRKP